MELIKIPPEIFFFISVLTSSQTSKSTGTGKRPFDLHAAYSTINADEDLRKRPILQPLDFKTILH